MKKPLRTFSLVAAAVVSCSAMAQEDGGVKVIANDSQGESVGEVVVTIDSKIVFTTDGVQILDKESQTAIFPYADISTLSFSTPEETGVASVAERGTIRLLENPVSSMLRISAPDNLTSSLTIHDISGSIRISLRKWDGEAVDVSNLSPGIYFVKINNTTLKFIKK